MKEHPDSKVVPISQNDSYVIESYCTCENCKQINREERSYSGTLIWFVNRVAEELKDEFPDVIFETLAYQFSALPPRNLKPAENVIVRYCISSCAPRSCARSGRENPFVTLLPRRTAPPFVTTVRPRGP